jgi:pimeloyl-ACP methyl ester carboxylesterase
VKAARSPAVIAVNRLRLRTITVPVLLIFGGESAVVTDGAGEGELALYEGSPDKTLTTIPGAGHMLLLERTAPTFRAELSGWLRSRGF